MNNKLFTIREALSVGWQQTKAHFWAFLVILLGAWIVSAAIGGFSGEDADRGLLSSIITLLGYILMILIQMGLIRVVLKFLDNGGKASINDFYSSFMQFLKFLGVSILSGIVIIIGLVALVIPGIILALRLQFSSYFVVDRNMGPIKAMKASWEMTRGQTWNLFLLMLAIIVMVLIGALLLGVGLLVAVPISMVAVAYVYRKLSAMPAAAAASAGPAIPSEPAA